MYDWVIQLIDWGGYFGIFLLMLIETIFPPIPSELILTLAGIRAAQGPLGLPGVIAFATAGAMLGNFLWYLAARSVRPERFRYFVSRHGRWIAMDLRDLDRMQGHFERYGAAIVMIGRVLPAIRTFISVPPGLLRMPVGRYLLWSTIGTGTFSALLAIGGYALGLSFERVEEIVAPLAVAMIGGGLVWYIWRQLTWSRRPH